MSSMLSPAPRTPHTALPAPAPGRSPSPNYFGLAVDPNSTTVTSTGSRAARPGWSPPSYDVRSAAASPPQNLPIHTPLRFDSFRRASDKQPDFALDQGSIAKHVRAPSALDSARPPNPRRSSRSDATSTAARTAALAPPPKADTVAEGEVVERASRSPKRHLPADAVQLFDRHRRESPVPSNADEKQPQPAAPNCRLDLGQGPSMRRAETLPTSMEPTTPVLVTPQRAVDVLTANQPDVLVLDLRVATQYAKARIRGALNLCIPTTLLKRPSYNVPRLADTFKDDRQKVHFGSWRRCKSIVVYDGSSSQIKDAANCVNILKKFSNEGWLGEALIVRGGFSEFHSKLPQWVEKGGQAPAAAAATDGPGSGCQDGDVAPVIGGCPLPATENAANPFFGNIRQNMDLIGGVGQIPVNAPASMDANLERALPRWLQSAVAESDSGKHIADNFLHIEQREQRRMQDALSAHVVYGTPDTTLAKKVQVAGIEKGSKNRYNNIFPYEHSRVRLQDVGHNGCDYVNANFLTPSRSNKRYIATQAPIPTTFTDFWTMVWQRNVRVVVMLTAESENGQLKAHNYWKDRQYGPLKLTFLSQHRASLDPTAIQRHIEQRPSVGSRQSTTGDLRLKETLSKGDAPSAQDDRPFVTVRKFTLSHENEPFERMREITHLQYTSWPDFGAPAEPAHLLGLIEQTNAVFRSTLASYAPSSAVPPSDKPVLVHCSAGCGRTGTFCTVDTVIDMLKRQRTVRSSKRQASPLEPAGDRGREQEQGFFARKEDAALPGAGGDDDWLRSDDVDLLETTAEEFRKQRLSMVQSLRQFVLSYESVLEWYTTQTLERSNA